MTKYPPLADLPLPEIVPVFPLPETVFFPRTILPLHIFEPRYHTMVRKARAGNRIIAMALLKPDWEPEYYDSPAVYDLGCAGLMEELVELPGNRFNIKLSGICRVRFEVFEQERPYRTARITPVPETVPPADPESIDQVKRGLVGAHAMMMHEATGDPVAAPPDVTDVPLQVVVNTFCAQVDLPVAAKQQLLDIDDVLERGRVLTNFLMRESDRLHRRRDADDAREKNDTVH